MLLSAITQAGDVIKAFEDETRELPLLLTQEYQWEFGSREEKPGAWQAFKRFFSDELQQGEVIHGRASFEHRPIEVCAVIGQNDSGRHLTSIDFVTTAPSIPAHVGPKRAFLGGYKFQSDDQALAAELNGHRPARKALTRNLRSQYKISGPFAATITVTPAFSLVPDGDHGMLVIRTTAIVPLLSGFRVGVREFMDLADAVDVAVTGRSSTPEVAKL